MINSIVPEQTEQTFEAILKVFLKEEDMEKIFQMYFIFNEVIISEAKFTEEYIQDL